MISPGGLKKEIIRRRNHKPVPIVLRADFPHQTMFVEDPSRYLAAQCSRRAGKSNGLALRFFNTMERHPNSQCLYLSLTQESARSIFWPVLHELNEIHKLGCTFVESRMTMIHPNGAKLKLMGADLKDFIKRLKGRKFPGVGVDESQDFSSHLQSLVDDVLTPSIADYSDGWLALTGTPGPVPSGFFFEVTNNAKYGFSLHKWDLTKNPFMPDVEAFIQDLCKKREWQENNPTLLREYRNKWVLDVESLWVRYKESVNNFQQLPVITPHNWNYIMGIDLGFKDADAIAILAWSEHDPNTYLVEECITRKQGITELVQQIEHLEKKYKVAKMVIDEGGLGKKIAEELRRQKGIPVQQADKARKQENVEFLNDALRTGRFKAKANSKFAQDSYLVQIDWDKSTHDKIVIKKHPHSDIIDAVLYAFKESPAFSYLAPPKKLIPGSKEWAEQQSQEMFEAELDGLQRENEYNNKINGFCD